MNGLGKNYDIDFRENVEIEILGSIMGLPEHKEIKSLLKNHNLVPNDFYKVLHKEIFTAILECYQNDMNTSLVSVSHFRPLEYRTNNSKQWDYETVGIVQKSLMSSWGFEHNIMLLKQFVIMDFWNNNSHRVLQDNWNNKDVLRVSDDIVEGYKGLYRRLTDGIKTEEQHNYSLEIKNKVKRRNLGQAVGITTSVEVLDDFTGGYSLGELFIIAARPGMGKTTYALISAWNSSLQGNKVVFYSLEMAKNQLKSKLIGLITGIEYKRIKKGALSNEELQKVLEADELIDNSNLIINDSIRTIEDITETAREYAEQGVKLFFMDYIQRCKSRSKMEIRHLIILITRELKSIAKECYVAFIALSQLSRAVEQRPNKRPRLSDLKESSSIEEDADVVGFLFRQAYYDEMMGESPGYSELFHTEFIIEKVGILEQVLYTCL